MDEVFIAVVRRAAEQMREAVAQAAASDAPLRALRQLNQDPRRARRRSNASLASSTAAIALQPLRPCFRPAAHRPFVPA